LRRADLGANVGVTRVYIVGCGDASVLNANSPDSGLNIGQAASPVRKSNGSNRMHPRRGCRQRPSASAHARPIIDSYGNRFVAIWGNPRTDTDPGCAKWVCFSLGHAGRSEGHSGWYICGDASVSMLG